MAKMEGALSEGYSYNEDGDYRYHVTICARCFMQSLEGWPKEGELSIFDFIEHASECLKNGKEIIPKLN